MIRDLIPGFALLTTPAHILPHSHILSSFRDVCVVLHEWINTNYNIYDDRILCVLPVSPSLYESLGRCRALDQHHKQRNTQTQVRTFKIADKSSCRAAISLPLAVGSFFHDVTALFDLMGPRLETLC